MDPRYHHMRRVVDESGLWKNGRQRTHSFLLSPSVYQVSAAQLAQLHALGGALHECMHGLGHLAVHACDRHMSGDHTLGMIARLLRTGVPKHYHEIMLENPDLVPGMCKVDLMVQEDGTFRIAEVDGHNKHGLGYSTLARRLSVAATTDLPDSARAHGSARALADAVGHGKQLILLYADQERFYLPEFEILRDELTRYGVELIVVAESECHIEYTTLHTRDRVVDLRNLVDLPFLFHNVALNVQLALGYRLGVIDFVIPPKPYLGSKAVLALLRNDSHDPKLEAVLGNYIPHTALRTVRQYIPETHMVHRRVRRGYWEDVVTRKRFVLKESISSGMKGTVFSDDANFPAILHTALSSNFRFVLQEEITNRGVTYEHFDEAGAAHRGTWFQRVTVHFCASGVADIVVTARRDKKVHGAPDCLQLGTVII